MLIWLNRFAIKVCVVCHEIDCCIHDPTLQIVRSKGNWIIAQNGEDLVIVCFMYCVTKVTRYVNYIPGERSLFVNRGDLFFLHPNATPPTNYRVSI